MYILDSNVFRELISHLPKKGKTFEQIWDNIEKLINREEIISVDECYNELEKHYSEKADQFKWIHSHKGMFKNPDNEESRIISQIFQSSKGRENVHLKNILENRPAADVYIVAKAKKTGAIVVTCEVYKPHSSQLPNLCEKMDVSYISYDDFMAIISE